MQDRNLPYVSSGERCSSCVQSISVLNTRLLPSSKAFGVGMLLICSPLCVGHTNSCGRYYTRRLYNVIKQDFRNHIKTIAVYATTIQRHWRGHAARKRYATLRARTQLAAQLQCAARAWIARRAYTQKKRKSRKSQKRITTLENECVALRTQMSNLNKYVLALAALVKQSGQYPSLPSPSSSSPSPSPSKN